jgi:predicted outer membrane protein
MTLSCRTANSLRRIAQAAILAALFLVTCALAAEAQTAPDLAAIMSTDTMP